MGSPKHLWSGDWQDESAAAAARRRPIAEPTPEPQPAPVRERPRPARPPRPRRRLRMSRQEMRRWAIAGGLALLVGFIATSLANILTRDDAKPAAAVSHGSGTAGIGARLRTSREGGALIESLTPGSPAGAAGLAPGDLIVGVDNTSVTSADDVNAALASHRAGDVVAVTARRGGAGFTAQVTLETRRAGGP